MTVANIKLKHKGLKRRTVTALSRHSRTFFMFIVAFSSVVLYMTSRMLRNSHSRMDVYMRMRNNKAILRSQGKDTRKSWKKDEKELNARKQIPEILQRIDNKLIVRSLDELSLTEKPKKYKEVPPDNFPKQQLKVDSNLSNFCKKSSIFLLVLIFSEEPKSSLRHLIRKTWCQRQIYSNKRRVTCLFMIGQHSSRQEFAESTKREAVEKGDIILMSLHDDVRNSTQKMIMGMEWVTTNCPNTNFILRTEDDVIINMANLMENILPHIPLRGFAGGRLISESPVRNFYSKYYVSYEDYRSNIYPPLCNNMGYILSHDVLRQLYQATFHNRPIPLDNIYVGVLLNSMDIPVKNMSTLVYGKAFQLDYDSEEVICDYVIIHLHGNSEDDASKVWSMMRNQCNRP